ncbi:hypothetical protein MKW92_003490 [Papaver armeniacum]|nr:hypothetical protein MKW92_003490 [Papaver armeniacum]
MSYCSKFFDFATYIISSLIFCKKFHWVLDKHLGIKSCYLIVSIFRPFCTPYLPTILLQSVWTALAQKFARTCWKNEGIVKHARSAETCDDCTVQCGKKCPGGTFLLEQRFCKKEPCPQPNPLLKKGVCLVRSHHKSNVVCFCCCVDKFITE